MWWGNIKVRKTKNNKPLTREVFLYLKMSIEGEIFEDRPKEGFGLHNVGPGVLRASDPGVIEMVANHYGPRCGHVPSQAEGRTGFIVYQATELIEGQLEYLRKITGRKFEQVDLSTFKTPGGLVVPYINDPATEKMLQERGARGVLSAVKS